MLFVFAHVLAVLNIVAPLTPTAPVAPVAPVSPFGIVKLNVAADVVPPLETVADVPAAPVVVVPTVIVAAAPLVPFVPFILLLPLLPLSPRGIVKFSVAVGFVPVFVTEHDVPDAPVVTVPIVILLI